MASGKLPFDAKREQLAKIYASALLAAAEAQGVAASVVEETESLVVDVFDRLPDFEDALTSHFLDHEQREELIDKAFTGRASQLTLNLLKVLSLNERMELVRSIARQSRRLYDESQNRVAVNVRIASAASDATLAQIRNAVGKAFGIEPQLDVWIDPAILGGVVLRIGDTVYDGSVRTAFEQTRTRMLERAVEAIEGAPDRFLTAAGNGPAA